MLVGRAFVFSLDGRAVAAVAALALSVGYAVLAGSATSAIREPGEVVSEGFLEPGQTVHRPGFEPFDVDNVDAQAHLTNTTEDGIGWATIEPWPYGEEPVKGPYAPTDGTLPNASRGDNVTLANLETVEPPLGSMAWVYLPPAEFAQAFPSFEDRATQAFLEPGSAAPEGFESHPQKASGRFYVEGAEQIGGSVHALVAGMGVVAAVLSAGAIRLETLARRDQLATLETIAGRGLAKRVIAARTAVLSVSGVAVGLGLAWAGTRVLSGLLPGLAFSAPPLLVAEVAAVGLGAALVAGTLAGWRDLRHPVAERLGQRGTQARRFRGPLRFLLVTPRLWAGVLAAALVATAIVAIVSGAGHAPQALLGGDERTHVVGSATSNPFTGDASVFLADHAPSLADVDEASAETFAPTMIRGEPVMVHGVQGPAWRSMNDVHLDEGAWPTQSGEATAGQRLAQRLTLEPGDELVVPGAHRPVLKTLTITGIHAGEGFPADQLVTDLATAGDLAGKDPGSANLVRLQAPDAEARERLEAGLGIEVLDLSIDPDRPVPDTYATARLDVVNLAEERRSRSLSLQADGDLVASRTVELAGETRDTVEIDFPVPDAPTLDIEVNPQRTIDTATRELTIDAPRRIPTNTSLTLTVHDRDGNPVPSATISVDGTAIGTTNRSGQLAHTFTHPDRITISADDGQAAGGTEAFVLDPAWRDRPNLRIENLALGQAVSIESDRARYEADVRATNLGGAGFEGPIEASTGGEQIGTTTTSLAPFSTRTVRLPLEIPLDADTVTIQDTVFPVQPGSGDEEEQTPALETLLASQQDTQQAAEDEAFLERFFAQLDPVLLIVTLLTFAHAALAVAFGVLREVRERAAIGQTLRHLGAPREAVGARAARDAALSVLVPALAGVGLAFLGLEVMQGQGWPPAFGHTLPADLSLGLAIRLTAALIVVAAGTAAIAAATDRPAKPRQGAPISLDRLLEGSP